MLVNVICILAIQKHRVPSHPSYPPLFLFLQQKNIDSSFCVLSRYGTTKTASYHLWEARHADLYVALETSVQETFPIMHYCSQDRPDGEKGGEGEGAKRQLNLMAWVYDFEGA